jgi:hypothetical protein
MSLGATGGYESIVPNGGVGLVFRKDDTDSRFLLVHKITSGGPADVSGLIRYGVEAPQRSSRSFIMIIVPHTRLLP